MLVLCLSMACAAKYPHGGFAVKPAEAEVERGCQSGSLSACGALGRMLVEKEIDGDLERGIVLLEMACGEDDAPACTTLTAVYMRATQSGRALARAHDLAARACERGSADACAQLSDVIRLEHGPEERPYKACCDDRVNDI